MWKRKAVSGSARKISPGTVASLLGARIAKARKGRRWSRRHLARRLEVSPKTIANWEQGRCQPAVPLLVAIAEFFEISIDDLARADQTTEEN
jgi:transcriptional regulator with XRE-family HTH domain